MPWTQPQLWTTELIGFARQLGPCSLRHVFLGSGPFRPHFYDDYFLLQIQTQSVCSRSYDKQPLSTGRFPGLRSTKGSRRWAAPFPRSDDHATEALTILRSECPGQASENQHSIVDCCGTELGFRCCKPITTQTGNANPTIAQLHNANNYILQTLQLCYYIMQTLQLFNYIRPAIRIVLH